MASTLPAQQNPAVAKPSWTPEPRRLDLTVALAVLGVFVTYVPITAVSVVLTTIGRVTRADTSQLQWVSDAYIIPMAAAVLSAGVFGDLYGRRRVFLGGMALTLIGAAVAGLSGAFGGVAAIHMLWTGQAISGLGAGLLLPTTLALIAHVVPNPRDRGKYIGIWATGLLLGLAIGPVLSGLILERASYGWTFLPTVVLAAIAGAVALARLPDSKAPEGRRLDWPGQITATVAIAASIFGVIEGGNKGWSAVETIAGLCVGAAGFAAFIVTARRSDSPLLNLSLFRSAAFTAAGFSALISLFSVVGVAFLLSLFLGYVQHLSALQIGWRLLFITGVATVFNPVIGLVMHKVNVIYLLAGGLAISAIAVFFLTGVNADTGLLDLGWRLGVFGLSTAIMLTTVSVAAINAVPWKLAGMAAAANTAMRQYGSALGPAVLGVIFVDRTNSGASPTSALHTALLVDGILLGVAALACVLSAHAPKRAQEGPVHQT